MSTLIHKQVKSLLTVCMDFCRYDDYNPGSQGWMNMPAPTRFSDEVADQIVERMVDGESLRQICRDAEMPALRTVFNWLSTNPAFKQAYSLAADMRLDTWAEDLVDISDQSTPQDVQASRLRVDTRKWLMARLMPKKYGDRQQVETTAEVSIKEQPLDLSKLNRDERQVMRELLLKAGPSPASA